LNEKNSIEVKNPDNNLITCEKLKHKHTKGPLLENIVGTQYKKLYLKHIKIKVGSKADSYILNKSNEIIKLENIVNLHQETTLLLLEKYLKLKKLFMIILLLQHF